MTDSNKESEHATELSKELNLMLVKYETVDDLLSALINKYPREVREWFRSHSPRLKYCLRGFAGKDKIMWCVLGDKAVVKLIQIDGYALLSCPLTATMRCIEPKVANDLITIFKAIGTCTDPFDFILMNIKLSSGGLSFEEISRLCMDEGFVDKEIRLAIDELLTEGMIYITTGKIYKVA